MTYNNRYFTQFQSPSGVDARDDAMPLTVLVLILSSRCFNPLTGVRQLRRNGYKTVNPYKVDEFQSPDGV